MIYIQYKAGRKCLDDYTIDWLFIIQNLLQNIVL